MAPLTVASSKRAASTLLMPNARSSSPWASTREALACCAGHPEAGRLLYNLPVLTVRGGAGGRGGPDCLCRAQGQQVLQVVATLRPLVAMASGRPSYAGRLILPRAPAVSKTAFQVTT